MFTIKFKTPIEVPGDTCNEMVFSCECYSIDYRKNEVHDTLPLITGFKESEIIWTNKVEWAAYIMNNDGKTIDRIHASIAPKSNIGGGINC